MFETDYSSDSGNFSLLPVGKYECIIHKANINAMGRAIYFQVVLIIRNDVTQKYQNRRIFHAIWQKKPENRSEDDRKVDGFSYKQLMNLCQAAGLPGGKKYADIDALGADLIGRTVTADIIHDEWNGRTNERVKWFYETKYPNCQHQMREIHPVSESGGQIDVVTEEDDDLPF